MPPRAAKGNRMENAKTREIYKENFAEYLLCLAMDIGEGMLKCGAEVSRVEDTIERVCRAYGAAHVEVFSIISVINATVRMPDGTFSSQMRRVRSSGYDLTMLEKYNALSREVCRDTPALDDFDSEIHKIRSSVTYRWWVQLISLMSICSGFTFFFGGDIIDALIATVIGAAISVLEIFPSKYINSLMKTLISALIITLLCAISALMIAGLDTGAIIMGSIMPLVPGIAFGTAMRDLLLGELVSGSLKAVQSILQALMIAFAYLVVATLFGGVI